jgi:hypothetical protein
MSSDGCSDLRIVWVHIMMKERKRETHIHRKRPRERERERGRESWYHVSIHKVSYIRFVVLPQTMRMIH